MAMKKAAAPVAQQTTPTDDEVAPGMRIQGDVDVALTELLVVRIAKALVQAYPSRGMVYSFFHTSSMCGSLLQSRLAWPHHQYGV